MNFWDALFSGNTERKIENIIRKIKEIEE